MPSMETSVALVVCQVNVVESPLLMELGLAESDAVGAGGGGGGGGGGGAAFFLQAPNTKRALSPRTSKYHFIDCFTLLFPPATPKLRPGARRSYLLFPTPVRLRVVPSKSQLLNLRTVRQHGPDLQAPGTIRLKNDMPPIG